MQTIHKYKAQLDMFLTKVENFFDIIGRKFL